MRNVLAVLILSCFTQITAQKIEVDKISGIYHQKGSSPEGGTTYILYPNHQFVITFFGGILKGVWEQQGKTINLKTDTSPHYVCYGRYIPELEGIQIRFNVEETNETLIQLNTLNSEMTPLFNKAANCFSRPYDVTFKEQATALYFLETSEYLSPSPLYLFNNNQEFNQFLIINLKEEYTRTQQFSIPFVNNKLLFDSSTTSRKPLSNLSEEDAFFIENYLKSDSFPIILTPSERFYPNSDDPELTNTIPYTRLEATLLPRPKYTISKTPLLYYTCD
ncbi:hypothetical protein [Leeuwenhoekiella sp. NPDC079379]|uniref:hypothetical protein n=1 Tax=Leeuwenhoekiella sp. NPDC079379 TaxID=3364122 RepID=UPI0037CB8108